jgi:hypothetical protein
VGKRASAAVQRRWREQEWTQGVLLPALLAGTLLLAGCAASSIADNVPTAVGGLPEGAPARPQTPAVYPAVHDMPPPRATNVLSEEEQQKLEDELAAARKRAAGARKPAGGASRP